MPLYTYKLQNLTGHITRGQLEAPNRQQAILIVRKNQGTLLEVSEKKGLSLNILHSKPKLNLKDRIIFTEQLAVMLNAGITLVQALKGLAEESSNKGLALILQSIIADVEGGVQFSSALAKQSASFSPIYREMVKSAEKTGSLSEILKKLTIQQQKEYDLKGKVRGALIYPAIISVLLVGVMILVITFILPKLSGLFTESATSLPASTLFLLSLSSFFIHQWYILIGGVVGAYFGFNAITATPKGEAIWDQIKLKIPVLGPFSRKAILARFTQSFASLANAGVPVLEVFKTLEGVVGNSVYRKAIQAIAKDVSNGVRVSTAIRKSKEFPPMVGQLVAVGEQSGDLAGVFEVLGEFFEKEVDGMAKNLSTLLEPIIMVVMGAGVGFVLVSVLQPIYALVNAT